MFVYINTNLSQLLFVESLNIVYMGFILSEWTKTNNKLIMITVTVKR